MVNHLGGTCMSCEQQSPVAASTTQRVASVKKRGEEGGGE